jgi:hypothetical protein
MRIASVLNQHYKVSYLYKDVYVWSKLIRTAVLPQASKSLFERMAMKLRAAAAENGTYPTKTATNVTVGSQGTRDVLESKDGVVWTHALEKLNLNGRIGVLPGRWVYCLLSVSAMCYLDLFMTIKYQIFIIY